MAHDKKPGSIDEALKVLDEALAGVNPPALNDLVNDEFTNLKGALGRATTTRKSSAQDFIGEAVRGFVAPMGAATSAFASSDSYEKITEVAQAGIEEARRLGTEVDRNVRANPWPYLGGVAVGTLALGLMLGRAHANQNRI